MQTYLTPEEAAQQLKVEVGEILSLVQQGKLKAVRIGSSIRIPEAEFERLPVTCAAVPAPHHLVPAPSGDPELPAGARRCPLRKRGNFRVIGSIAEGAAIWPGRMKYPITFPKQFMDDLLAHFQEEEVAVGGKFDDPGEGSLGEFIQRKLGTKMNPAVYLAALLIDEGYADIGRRGYIRLHQPSGKARPGDHQ
jgi:excisionase family DNA binding protein